MYKVGQYVWVLINGSALNLKIKSMLFDTHGHLDYEIGLDMLDLSEESVYIEEEEVFEDNGELIKNAGFVRILGSYLRLGNPNK